VAGCYSSIFVSPMITAYWHKKERNVVADEGKPAAKEAEPVA